MASQLLEGVSTKKNPCGSLLIYSFLLPPLSFNVLHYAGFAAIFAVLYFALTPFLGFQVGLTLALLIWGFLVWL